jgi:hypothetical protein
VQSEDCGAAGEACLYLILITGFRMQLGDKAHTPDPPSYASFAAALSSRGAACLGNHCTLCFLWTKVSGSICPNLQAGAVLPTLNPEPNALSPLRMLKGRGGGGFPP